MMLGGMRTSEVAQRAGVNVQTLRYYERRGVLPDPPRSSAGYRAYPTDAIRVVRFVKRAQELGFSLNEVEALLHLADGGPQPCDTARAMAQERIAELDAKITDLERMRDSLRQLAATCARVHPQRERPLVKAIDTATQDPR